MPIFAKETFNISRLRTTIGRSARSDICIPDAFASRLHAEVRKEGDSFWLQDLGSANGTRYNGSVVSMPIPLTSGGEIQIGETVLVFEDERFKEKRSATLIAENTEALDPSKTIALTREKMPTAEILESQFSSRTELLGIISKVGVALLSSSGLSDTLNQVASLVFETVPAERCMIMLRDEAENGGMKILVARTRGKEEQLEEVRISRTVMDEVLKNGKSVLTSDAQHDPRYASQTMALLGIRSVLAVPLSVQEQEIFGLVYADSPTYETTFTEEHLNILTTLASVASIRIENAQAFGRKIRARKNGARTRIGDRNPAEISTVVAAHHRRLRISGNFIFVLRDRRRLLRFYQSSRRENDDRARRCFRQRHSRRASDVERSRRDSRAGRREKYAHRDGCFGKSIFG